MDRLIDKFNRQIEYLRISVTDRCNLRCIYCMPAGGILNKNQSEILSFEEIYRIVKVSARLGIRKVRITGGEPLVRKDLPVLIAKLKNISGLSEIALTTNGTYLNDYVYSLQRAGLDRVNVSLDSLYPEKYQEITRGGKIETVLKGIESALSAGLFPVKINTVLMKGFNADEILDFARLAKERPLQIRFIEYMRTSVNRIYSEDFYLSCLKAKEACQSLGELIPVRSGLNATAEVFKIKGFCGTIGFISPISRPFCSSCNKLRLTSDGVLKSCLHSPKIVNLKEALTKGIGDEELANLIRAAVSLKPAAHNLLDALVTYEAEDFSMCQIGG